MAEEEIPSQLTWVSNLPFELCIPVNHTIGILPPSALVTLSRSSSWIFAHLLAILSSFPGTHSMYFSFISKLCYLHLCTAGSQEGRGKWEACARSREQARSTCLQGGSHRAHTPLAPAGDTVLEAGCKPLLPGVTTLVFHSPHLQHRFRTENIYWFIPH